MTRASDLGFLPRHALLRLYAHAYGIPWKRAKASWLTREALIDLIRVATKSGERAA